MPLVTSRTDPPFLQFYWAKVKWKLSDLRLLSIIGITQQAADYYNVNPIEHLTEATCTKLLSQILDDEDYAITKKIPRNLRKNKVVTSTARTVRYKRDK